MNGRPDCRISLHFSGAPVRDLRRNYERAFAELLDFLLDMRADAGDIEFSLGEAARCRVARDFAGWIGSRGILGEPEQEKTPCHEPPSP